MAEQKRIEIVRPAHLVVCPECGLHAHIVFADGSESEERWSLPGMAEIINDAVHEGRLAKEEVFPLADQLTKTELSRLDEETTSKIRERILEATRLNVKNRRTRTRILNIAEGGYRSYY
jgi:hypothetical protein